MKLVFLLGSRGEWGYIRPLIEHALKAEHEVKICATNMSILFEYGDIASKLSTDGYPIDFRIISSVSGDTLPSMAKSIGLLEISLVDYLQWVEPDWLILAGDRAEQLAGAIVGSYCYIPTAHIQAGEKSGNIDGVARHAISKLVHLHFASNQDAYDRLIQMGEEEFRIHLTGAPQLDDIHQFEKYSIAELTHQNVLKNDSPYFVVCFHPDTNAMEASKQHLENLVASTSKLDATPVWILPNNDAGGEYIRDYVLDNLTNRGIAHANLDRRIYISLLHHAQFLIGNSSSGILEAPSLRLPVVNIGNRQEGRIQGENVINVSGEDEAQITHSISQAIKLKQLNLLEGSTSPYGDGKSSSRILKILESTKISPGFMQKKITY